VLESQVYMVKTEVAWCVVCVVEFVTVADG